MKFPSITPRTVLIGVALAAGIFIGIRFVFSPLYDPILRTIITFAGAVLGTIAGGFYAARQAIYHPVLHALLIALLDSILLVALQLLPVDLPLLALLGMGSLLGVFIANRVPISIVGTPFGQGRSYTSDRAYPTGSYSLPKRITINWPSWVRRLSLPLKRYYRYQVAKQLYNQLLQKTRMDSDLADRLIEFERKRNPYLTREILIRNAIERLDRDRR